MDFTSPLSLAINGGNVAVAVDAAVTAERHGFQSVWTTEYYNRSAIVSLTAMAAATARIGLGSGVAWTFGRSPLTLATEARTLDEYSGGRFSLGLGTGSLRRMTDWHGISDGHAAARVEELVPLLGQILRVTKQPVEHDGRFYRCHVQAEVPMEPLARGTISVLVAAVQPRLLRAVGSVADGLVGHPLFTRRYVDEIVRPALAEGAKKAGRDFAVPITGMVISSVAGDSATARANAAVQVAFYATIPENDSMFEFNGFTAEVAAIRAAFARRDLPGMTAAVSDRMLDELAVFGDAAEARDRYRERFDGLYEQPLIYSPSALMPPAYLPENLHALCEAFAAA
jgi:alkanesulfonate monooxygenase SsuD/methylene tetrahydromethanopterin reductase-like flavin-dependent oxidoreductase (luciferase family)